ncbi:MAG: hypothetical protein IJU66_05445 [Oscillospiraceae bacterium]|nr:hypothetical protein [Oscillospiraceae bacterium]
MEENRQESVGTAIARGAGNFIVGILLEFVVLLFPLVFLLRSVVEFSDLPPALGLSGGALTNFFESAYPLVILPLFLALFATLLFLLNHTRVRRAFLIFGVVFAVGCAAFFAASLLCEPLAARLTDDLRGIFGDMTTPFSQLLTLFMIPAFAIAAADFSVYATIRAIRGSGYDEADE